jgi:hypothetical protein
VGRDALDADLLNRRRQRLIRVRRGGTLGLPFLCAP